MPNELTTSEALNLCDQIAEMGLKWIPLFVNIITNGWPLELEKVRDIVDSCYETAKKGILVAIIA